MIARVVVLAALLVGLVAWERALAARAESERAAATSAVGRMVSAEELDAIPRAAFRVEWADGRPPVTIVPVRGTWRIHEAFQAPADARALEALLGAVTAAEGYVQTEDPEQAQAYGFGAADAFRVSICGPEVLRDPSGDVRWSVDVGRSRPGGDGAFLRPQGGSKIWAVDRDPRAILEDATPPGLPPLCDASLLGQAWLGAARGVRRAFVDRADGESIELAVRERAIDEEALRAGESPFEWVVDPEGAALVPHQARPTGYLAWLSSATYQGLFDPRRAAELGSPLATVTLFPAAPPDAAGAEPAPPLVLHVMPALADGRVPVVHEHAGSILLLAPGSEALVAPTRAQILDTGSENLWDRELTRMRAEAR